MEEDREQAKAGEEYPEEVETRARDSERGVCAYALLAEPLFLMKSEFPAIRLIVRNAATQ